MIKKRQKIVIRIDFLIKKSPGTVTNNLGEGLAVEKGSRVCQMKIQKAEQFKFVEVDELSETERGCGGFGHTGSK